MEMQNLWRNTVSKKGCCVILLQIRRRLLYPACNRGQTDACMTTTAEQYITYRHERTCHDLIILSLPARFDVSQGSSCCVKAIAVLHHDKWTAVLLILITPTATTIDDWLELSGSNMTSYLSM